MTSVQLQLPFNLPVQTRPRQLDKRLENRLSTTLSVRSLTTQSDIESILPLTREYAEEVNLHNAPYDELMVRCSLAVILNNQVRDYQNLFIVRHNNKDVGFLLASVSHSLYADCKVAHEELWFVTPSARGTGAPIALLRAYENWATEKGAVLTLTGSNNERSSEKTAKLLDKLGYRQIGVTFVKEF